MSYQDLEVKFCGTTSAGIAADGAQVEGYASLFDLPDKSGDIVKPGAYLACLDRMRSEGRSVKMLWQHDPAQPIGVWEDIREDQRGLFVKGRILTEIERGREAAAMLKAGVLDGLSIGYRTIRAERGEKGRRVLRELELWEVSLVTFPMLEDARLGAKAEGHDDSVLSELAVIFDAASRSLSQA